MALIAILVVAVLALTGTLVSDAMAVIAEVPGSRCKPGLKMVYAHQVFTPGEFKPGVISVT